LPIHHQSNIYRIVREANFRQARRFFRDNKLSYNDYKLAIRDLFKFEPKKKYVEELEDTGESDATSISENSEEEIDEIEEHDQSDDQVEEDYNQEENYLPNIEDHELNVISNRLNNSELNDTQPTYHLMEPRRDVLLTQTSEINNATFQMPIDVPTSTFLQSRSIPITNEIQRSSSEASVASTESQQNKIQCDFCFASGQIKYFTKRGMTKHHNSAHRPAI
jgi:hypothetical protein